MSKTVLITGASTGIGRSTAILFAEKGWNVIATMRNPEKANFSSDKIHVLPLDVTNSDSIHTAIAKSLEFGKIDVLVNNAGYGLMGAFENCSPAQIQRQFDTNVFGLMEVTRALLPHFRESRSGMIINVASIGGKMSFPTYSLYNSTKWAVEGFSEGLQYELEQFNIRVKLIEPGPIKTDFYDRSPEIATSDLKVYDEYVNKIIPKMNQAGEKAPAPEVVAKTIYKAATDPSRRLRYPADPGAWTAVILRKLLPSHIFSTIIRSNFH